MEEEENFLQTKKEITAVAFCTKCDTNWSKLPVQNNEDLDEAYETCPVCKQDNFLEDGRQGDTYFYDFEKGVRNTITGELKERVVDEMPPLRKKNLTENEKANIDAFYNREYFVERL